MNLLHRSGSTTPAHAEAHPVHLRTVKGRGGLELCVAEAGNPAGPAVLLLHGFCPSLQAGSERAIETFVSLLFHRPLPPVERAEVLTYNRQVPLHARLGVSQRVEDGDDVLAALKVPVLVTHGLADQLVLPETSRHIASLVKHAELSRYPEVAHSPFWELAPRFNQELARFVARCR